MLGMGRWPIRDVLAVQPYLPVAVFTSVSDEFFFRNHIGDRSLHPAHNITVWEPELLFHFNCINFLSHTRNLLHEPTGIFSGGAAYSETIDFQRRDADAYRHSLAVFAASADAFVKLQVISHHRHTR
jgi:hypothetical protein